MGNRNPKVREVRSPGELQNLWECATRDGTDDTIVGQRSVA